VVFFPLECFPETCCHTTRNLDTAAALDITYNLWERQFLLQLIDITSVINILPTLHKLLNRLKINNLFMKVIYKLISRYTQICTLSDILHLNIPFSNSLLRKLKCSVPTVPVILYIPGQTDSARSKRRFSNHPT